MRTVSAARSGIPNLWNVHRSSICAALVGIGLVQTLGAILLSLSCAALLQGKSDIYGLPVELTLLGSFFATTGLFIAQSRYAEYFALSYIHDLRIFYARHVMVLPAEGKVPGLGLSMTRLVNDLAAIKLWLARGLVAMIILAPTVVTLGLWLTLAKPAFLIPFLLCLVSWCVGFVLVVPRLRESIRQTRAKRGAIASIAGRVIPDRIPLLLHGKLDRVIGQIAKRSLAACGFLAARATWSGVLKTFSRAALPISVCAYAVLSDGNLEDVALFLLVFAFLTTQLEAGAAGVEYFEANKLALAKIQSILNLPTVESEEATSRQGGDWSSVLTLDGLELPSGRVFSSEISPGTVVNVTGYSAQDYRFIALGIAGLLPIEQQRHILLGTVSFDRIERDQIWGNVALVSPLNSIPNFQAKKPAFALGAEYVLRDKNGDKIPSWLGVLSRSIPAKAVQISAQDQLRIRLARALLRRPRILVVHDELLVEDDLLVKMVLDWAEEQSATVVFCCARNACIGDI